MNPFKLIALLMLTVSTAFAQIVPPQGRLTLQEGTPVMTQDVVDATTLYYTPYVGNSLPVSNGTSLSNQTFSELSMTLSAEPENLADVYAIYVSGAFQLCVRTGWSGNSRASEFGLTQLQGVWVNANTLTDDCGNSTNNYTVPAQEGIYLGTIYTSPHPASSTVGMTVQFKPPPAAGGTRNLVGIWNAYNRVPFHSINCDSNGSWTNTNTSSWSPADGPENFNQTTWVDGLQQVQVKASYIDLGATNTNATAIYLGLLLDNNNGTPDLWSVETFGTASNWNTTLNVGETFPPQIGLHYVQAMDLVGGASPTGTFYGNEYAALILDGEY
jgi:hypothetical protein